METAFVCVMLVTVPLLAVVTINGLWRTDALEDRLATLEAEMAKWGR